jgi:hypothetical protein
MPSIRKYVLKSEIEAKGWNGITTGKILPSFCENCKVQRQHKVTGEAKRENDALLRLECEHCHDRIEGRGVMR